MARKKIYEEDGDGDKEPIEEGEESGPEGTDVTDEDAFE